MFAPAVMGLGPTELLIIAGIIILLFGAAKLPELARGSGRALRIFKTETKGLMDDDDDARRRPPSSVRSRPGARRPTRSWTPTPRRCGSVATTPPPDPDPRAVT